MGETMKFMWERREFKFKFATNWLFGARPLFAATNSMLVDNCLVLCHDSLPVALHDLVTRNGHHDHETFLQNLLVHALDPRAEHFETLFVVLESPATSFVFGEKMRKSLLLTFNCLPLKGVSSNLSALLTDSLSTNSMYAKLQ